MLLQVQGNPELKQQKDIKENKNEEAVGGRREAIKATPREAKPEPKHGGGGGEAVLGTPRANESNKSSVKTIFGTTLKSVTREREDCAAKEEEGDGMGAVGVKAMLQKEVRSSFVKLPDGSTPNART